MRKRDSHFFSFATRGCRSGAYEADHRPDAPPARGLDHLQLFFKVSLIKGRPERADARRFVRGTRHERHPTQIPPRRHQRGKLRQSSPGAVRVAPGDLEGDQGARGGAAVPPVHARRPGHRAHRRRRALLEAGRRCREVVRRPGDLRLGLPGGRRGVRYPARGRRSGIAVPGVLPRGLLAVPRDASEHEAPPDVSGKRVVCGGAAVGDAGRRHRLGDDRRMRVRASPRRHAPPPMR